MIHDLPKKGVPFVVLGNRGFNDIVFPSIGEVVFKITAKNGKTYDKAFWNVGQPNQDPPVHPLHKDIPDVLKPVKVRSFELHKPCINLDLSSEYGDLVKLSIWGNGKNAVAVLFSGDVVNVEPSLSGKVEVVFRNGVWYLGVGRWSVPEPCKERKPVDPAYLVSFANLSWNESVGFYVPVNKMWIPMIESIFQVKDRELEGPLVFAWDGAFSSIIMSRFNVDLAVENLRAVFKNQQKNGRIPQVVVGDRVSDRTNPPIVFMAVEELYELSLRIDIVKEFYPLLKNYYLWLVKNRDRNGDGLMEWGSDPDDGSSDIKLPGKLGAVYESGLDDSPMWDEVEFSEVHLTLNAGCVDLTALTLFSADVMSRFSAVLDLREDVEFFEKEKKRLLGSLKQLYDFSRGIFANRMWSGEFVKEITPTSFYPLLVSDLPGYVVEDVLKFLVDKRYFWSKDEKIIPSVSKVSPHFNGDGDYWRGRIWPPMVYLVWRGVRNYDKGLADEIATRAKELALKDWIRDGHVHENYSFTTGFGEPLQGVYARSCPMYSWGGLMFAMGLNV